MDVETLFTVFAGLLGAFLGWIFATNGFAQPVTEKDLAQAPRVKNLFWLFSGGLVIFVTDYRKLNLPEDFPAYDLAASYGICALVAAFAAIIWTACSISRSVRRFNDQHPDSPAIDAGALIRKYLQFGSAAQEAQFNELTGAVLKTEKEARDSAAERRLSDTTAALKAERETGVLVEEIIVNWAYTALRHQSRPQTKRKAEETSFIQAAETAIRVIVQAHAGAALELRFSLMDYIAIEAANSETKAAAKFTDGMDDTPVGYLQLRRGGMPREPRIVLPVASDGTKTLPGAPTAAGLRNAWVMNIDSIEFRPAVSTQAQDAIKAYFADPYFKGIASITSMVIFKDDKPRGVLNIESNASDLLGKGIKAAGRVEARLKPVIALLSVIY